MPLLDVVRLDTMVTVVDSSVFLDAYVSRDSVKDRPELGTTYHIDHISLQSLDRLHLVLHEKATTALCVCVTFFLT
jgi:G3E family GTPase